MATYAQIQAYIKEKHGYTAKTCWIAHAKKQCGLNPKVAPNRRDPDRRVFPCPDDKLEDIKEAFRYFGML